MNEVFNKLNNIKLGVGKSKYAGFSKNDLFKCIGSILSETIYGNRGIKLSGNSEDIRDRHRGKIRRLVSGGKDVLKIC